MAPPAAPGGRLVSNTAHWLIPGWSPAPHADPTSPVPGVAVVAARPSPAAPALGVARRSGTARTRLGSADGAAVSRSSLRRSDPASLRPGPPAGRVGCG